MAKEKKSLGSLAQAQDMDTESLTFEYDGQTYKETLSNLELTMLTPDDVRMALNRAPAKFAFWGAFQAQVSERLDDEKSQLDFWFADKYRDAARDDPKSTETAKRNYIMLTYSREYSSRLQTIRALEFVRERVSTLVKAFEMQSRTLQSIAGLMRAELEHIAQ